MKSRLTVVYGGQFGSEGKGQIVAHISQRLAYSADHVIGVRVGGPNAGHTFYDRYANKMVVQSLPVTCAFGFQGAIGAAGVFIPELLIAELEAAAKASGRPPRLLVDRNAAIITPEHMGRENALKGRIGSTGEGVGAATADKVMRTNGITVADKIGELAVLFNSESCSNVCWLDDTPVTLNSHLTKGGMIIVEGTQGFGLSLHTGGYYPYCTSRECTPNALLAETGIAREHAAIYESIAVIRTYPIRVGGNSGPLPREISWDILRDKTNGYVREPEITTVTKKQRRIAELDMDMLRRMVLLTKPTGLALAFFDYWFPETLGYSEPSELQPKHWEAINRLEAGLGVPVKYLSTGPGQTMALRATL